MSRIAIRLFAAVMLFALEASASGEPLKGRYDLFVQAAAACVAATGADGVDRASVASSGWPQTGSAETDETILTAAYSEANPFVLRINGHGPLDPEGCWFTAEFRAKKDFAEVRRRLERRFGRAPDEVDRDDMQGTRWLNPNNVAELWMMPAHKLCSECPTMFFSVNPRPAK